MVLLGIGGAPIPELNRNALFKLAHYPDSHGPLPAVRFTHRAAAASGALNSRPCPMTADRCNNFGRKTNLSGVRRQYRKI
jgi:hypothetical protein